MNTRKEELEKLISGTKAEIVFWIEKLTSKDMTQNDIDGAKEFLCEVIELRIKHEIELAMIGDWHG